MNNELKEIDNQELLDIYKILTNFINELDKKIEEKNA